jgi:hypothetical protein
MDKQINTLYIAVGAVVLATVLQLLMAIPFMWLWDTIMPDLFGLKPISWLQAWGLMIMANIMFRTHIERKVD